MKLNDSKTDVLILVSPHDLPHVIDTAIQVGDISITSSQSARNLGIMLDQTFSMKQHIIHVCKPISERSTRLDFYQYLQVYESKLA